MIVTIHKTMDCIANHKIEKKYKKSPILSHFFASHREEKLLAGTPVSKAPRNLLCASQEQARRKYSSFKFGFLCILFPFMSPTNV